ncbi:MAG: hypothetical protein SFX74_13235, partial [Fimbriimonadaceae bacterium]|nr:hypothetical protein [Fimbriimonadaceae bacterium]
MLGTVFATLSMIHPGVAATTGNTPPTAPSRYFTENRGQWDAEARFLLQSPGSNLWITKSGAVIDTFRIDETRWKDAHGDEQVRRTRTGDVVRVDFVGASSAVSAVGIGRSSEYVSFLTQGREIGHVGRFAEATLVNVLPGVTARYYVDGGAPRYDVILAPGAEPESVRLKYTNARHLRVGVDGSLLYDTTMGTHREQNLFVYQSINGVRQRVPAAFEVRDGQVGFRLGAYDPAHELVIDPQILHAGTYLGGSGSDRASDVQVHASGDVIVAGGTTSTDFPTVAPYAGDAVNNDWFITRYRPDLSRRVFSTYLSGNGDERLASVAQVHIETATNGDIWFAGTSDSTDLPTTSGVIQPTKDSMYSVYLARFGASPSAPVALKVASYLGGERSETLGGLALHEPSGNIAIGIQTNSSSFDNTVTGSGARGPLVVGSAASAGNPNSSNTDAYIGVLNARLDRVLVGTFFGGNRVDRIRAVAFGRRFDTVFFGGETFSTDIPWAYGSPSTFANAFLGQIKIHDGSLVNAIGFGSDFEDSIRALAVDPVTNNVFATGDVGAAINTPGWGSTIMVQIGQDGTIGSSTRGDAFVAQFNDRLDRVRFTFLGSISAEVGEDIVVTLNGGCIVVGFAESAGIPIVTAGGTNIVSPGPDGSAFLARYSSALRLQGSSLFGTTGSTTDIAYAVALRQPFNSVYVAGETAGSDLQVTPGVAQPTSGGGVDAFVYDMRFYTDTARIVLSGDTVTPTTSIRARGFLHAQVVNPAGQVMTFRLSHPSARFRNGQQEISVTIPVGQISAAVEIFGTGAGVPQLTFVGATSAGTTESASFT